ncbi:MAG TPA: glycosyltransferase family 4 protein [Gemmatimonadales bacterium]|jgi:phosphatidylinositol alpha-1,6-mannosyltransferase
MTIIAHPHDLLLARDFPPIGGGIARWMEAFALGSPAQSLTVSTGAVVGADASDARLLQPIDRVPVAIDRLRTIPGLAAWSRRIVALARDRPARVAWCDTIRPAGYAARWLHARTGTPYLIMVVGNDLMTLSAKLRRGTIKRPLIRSVLHRAAGFVAISEWTGEQCRTLLDELGLDDAMARVHVIPLGADPARFQPDAGNVATFRQRHGLPDGRWLVTVARLVDYKGQDDAIRLLAGLAPDYPALHYAIVGRGPHETTLRDLAVTLGVADRVHLLTDVTDAELPAAYSLADVYLGLTRETAADVEGFGLALVEASACGVAVVATQTGGIGDAVADGVTGIRVPPDDSAATSLAVRALLEMPERARQLGAAGRARVVNYLNWDRVVADMRAVAASVERVA